MSNAGVAAVVVTWNRCDLLAESLRALDAQTLPPQRIVVVDNASDDGTQGLLAREFPHVDVVRTRRNTGGAGGFALGLRRALDTPCDAVWLMDDDTVPETQALAALVAARQSYVDPAYRGRLPAVVASRVVWTDGRDHPMNTPRRRPGARAPDVASADAVGCVPIRSASFVSILVDAALARERGLPVADYFLWNDDFEYTTRLIRGRVGLWCPASVVVHKTATFGSTDADPGERFFYEVRNKVWLFRRSGGLAPLEKAAYAGSTLRRWVHTFAGSTDRRTLWRGLRRGITDGIRTRPADTAGLIDEALGGDEAPPPSGGRDSRG
ncbi:MAG: glycosyltransferase [Nocardioidaceae bacterium]|nr:glycosyltransferase [Nocardioidaceae bacterium]